MQKLPDVLLQYKIFPHLTVLEAILLFLTNKRFSKLLKPIIENHPDFYYKAVWQGPKLIDEYYISNAFILPDNLQYCFMKEANLEGANLTGANLIGANLIGANLIGANLEEANLSGANLTDADLAEAWLYKAILEGANLTDAILYCANLADANLAGVDLEDADLRGAMMPVGWSLVLSKD
jgi:uncharacterized protein YjbI with pentapeptide repeats